MALYDINQLRGANLGIASNILQRGTNSINNALNNSYEALQGLRKDLIINPTKNQKKKNTTLLENQINNTTDRTRLNEILQNALASGADFNQQKIVDSLANREKSIFNRDKSIDSFNNKVNVNKANVDLRNIGNKITVDKANANIDLNKAKLRNSLLREEVNSEPKYVPIYNPETGTIDMVPSKYHNAYQSKNANDRKLMEQAQVLRDFYKANGKDPNQVDNMSPQEIANSLGSDAFINYSKISKQERKDYEKDPLGLYSLKKVLSDNDLNRITKKFGLPNSREAKSHIEYFHKKLKNKPEVLRAVLDAYRRDIEDQKNGAFDVVQNFFSGEDTAITDAYQNILNDDRFKKYLKGK